MATLTNVEAVKTLKNLSLAFILLINLSACGYSLRGSDVLSAQLPQLRLNLVQQNSDFNRLFRRSLENAGVQVELVDEIDLNYPGVQMMVSDEEMFSRPISVNPRARAAQFEMRIGINAAVSQGEEILLEPEVLFVEKIYFEDIENISGNQEEVEIIADEMRRELVNQLMRRLEGLDFRA